MQETQETTTSRQMLKEVQEGLSQPQKTLPSKFFYDNRGSELFEQITKLDEYYPTRTEIQILSQNIDDITERIGEQAVLVELGSGNSQKSRLLLENLSNPAGYIPIDISKTFLESIADNLKREYPDLLIHPLAKDYTSPFSLPNLEVDYNRFVGFYPGSTIGNFKPRDARQFLEQIADILGPSGALLIGVDLKKDKIILENAYNDAKGITAAFNKNMLIRLNREVGTNFNVGHFEHLAIYNEDKGRIEMHLISQDTQQVQVGDERFVIQEGESIHTENSYKYSLEEFYNLVKERYQAEKVWTDSNDWFSVHFLSVK